MVEALSAELRDELAANDVRRLVDPRTKPVRFRHLVAMGRSPLHCLAAFQEPDDRGSLSMRLGAGAHGMLLDKPVVAYPGKVRRGKEYDAFVAAHPRAVILNAREHAKATAISRAVRSHAEAAALLLAPDVTRERELHWSWMGRRCVSTPDAFGRGAVVELKTTRCAQPDRFVRDGTFRAYHAQLSWYSEALRSLDVALHSAYVVAVESEAPHAVTVLKLTGRALEAGARLVRAWWERLRVCEDCGEWPQYTSCVADFDVPDDDLELTFADDEDEGDEP